jgi:stage II sporulation protein D
MRHGGTPTQTTRGGVRRRPDAAPRRPAALALGALALAAAVPVLAVPAAPAGAAERVVIRGAGFGHGVGLSQYGARGMALKGFSARRILRHYYRGTSLQRSGAAARNVRVALQTGRRETTVSGAKSIGGLTTKTTRSYRIVRTASGITIRQIGRKEPVGRSSSGVEVLPGNATTLRVAGRAADGVQDGSFRGTLDVLPDGPNLLVVNELDIEQYLRGVVTEETPSSWPSAALQAQAVVARTYAITNAVGGRAFDQWPDTRSQVYTGISGESGPGDAAIAATRGQVVTLNGTPVITYFFSTSGGRTEDSSNVFGGESRSWLQSVSDPYEKSAGSPLYRWTRSFSTASADARTRRFGVGALRRIEILSRGDSPRVTRARVVGATGSREIDGGQLQRAFSLPDRWATVGVVSMSRCLKAGPTAAEQRAIDARRAVREQRRVLAAARAEQRRRARDPQSAVAAVGVGVTVRFHGGGDRTTTTPGAPTPAPVLATGTGTTGAPAPGTTSPSAPTDPGGPAAGAIAVAGAGAEELGALLAEDARPAPTTRSVPARAARRSARCRLVGGVRPVRDGATGRLQRKDGGRWVTVREVALKDGRFETVVPKSGSWRVRVAGFTTPVAGL